MGLLPPKPELDLSQVPEQCQSCGFLVGRVAIWESIRSTYETTFDATWSPLSKIMLAVGVRLSDTKVQADIDRFAYNARNKACSGVISEEVCGLTLADVVNEELEHDLLKGTLFKEIGR